MKLFMLAALSASIMFSSCSNVGEKAPEFNLKTIDGVEINSTDLKGKIIVVNVWATWCPTCIQEMPSLNRLHAKYAGDTSIVFIALCDDGTRDMRVIFDRHDFNYLHVANAAQYSDRLQTRMVKTYPQNLIVNSDFEIVYEVSDRSSNIYRQLDEMLTTLIAERSRS